MVMAHTAALLVLSFHSATPASLFLSTTVSAPPPAPPPAYCDARWLATGRVDAADPACGLHADGARTDGAAALSRCAALAANCSATLAFGPGRYLIGSTVVLSQRNGTGAGVVWAGAGDDGTLLCTAASADLLS